MQDKKLIVGLITLTLGMSGVLSWYLFASSPAPHSLSLNRAEIGSAADQESEPEISVKPGRVAVPAPISSGEAISAETDGKGRVLFYDPESGVVTAIDYRSGREEIISPTRLIGFIKTIWAPSKEEVISQFSSSQGATFRYFNYLTKRVVSLGHAILSPVFSPDSSRIAYFTKTATEAGIYIATPDNSESKRILGTRFSKAALAWPGDDLISIIVTDDQGQNSLFTVTPEGKLTKLAEAVDHLEVRWSKGGVKALISLFDTTGKLYAVVLDPRTLEQHVLDVETRASQCVWGNDNRRAICAVSQTPISLATVENQSKTPQNFYEIDTVSGEKKLLSPSGVRGPRVYVSEILLSPAEDYLFFVNDYDQKLYSFKLP